MKLGLSLQPWPRIAYRPLWWVALPVSIALVGQVVRHVPPVRDELARQIAALTNTQRLWATGAGMLISIGGGFVALMAMTISWQRMARAVRAVEGFACERCLHDVRGIPTPGVCPECGAAFDAHALRANWIRVRFYRAPDASR
ncbi:MAG: hypothetical protein SFY95_10840 [Planctomycetota bacterium]|nr:hypothetical protein [Planctomycetota bacterium]